INVSDAQAAASNQFPYNTWNIITPAPDQNGYVWRDYEFSSTCNLSTSDFENLNSISVYPNPVKDKLWFENPNQVKINKAEVYNISGQLIKTFYNIDDYVNLGYLTEGIYFIKVMSNNTSNTFKLLKS
ncbi:MAG: T9SS type A sorting domain-containing protein, partial [Psychroflexus sp.]